MSSVPRLGELLLREGLIKAEQLEKILEEQRRTGQRFGVALAASGLVREGQVLRVLEKAYGLTGIDLNNWKVPDDVIALVPREICEKHCIIPVSKNGNILVVAFSDPNNMFVRDDLQFLTRCKIQVVVAPESSIMASIDRFYTNKLSMTQNHSSVARGEVEEFEFSTQQEGEVIDAEGPIDEAPIVRFVNAVLTEAIKKRASDIHFEPYEKKFRVRFRIDGALIETTEPPQGAAAAIVSRIKIMSRLDIAEKRKPQDGRLKVRTQKGKEIDFRVSTIPTLWGEKAVLRLLDKSNLQLDMTKLGFEGDDLQNFLASIKLPQGMILITGPTGSGKTTTIYSALAELNKADVNISTAEDPVEFNLEGINQVQVNPDIDLDFAAALRSFLRQDPDIVMVGEIRDLETAEIAFKAASTGHLVVSTLHTLDAPATVIRLTEMGIAPYLITSTVSLIVSQRLVGKICDGCKTPLDIKPQVLIDLGIPMEEIAQYRLFKGKGCNHCNGTGIRGRLAIYELMKITEAIRDAILAGASTSELRRIAKEDGMRTLRRSALLKLKRGETTIEEVVNASVKDS